MSKRWLPLLAGLVLVVGLPVASHWWRQSAVVRCALDGSTIDPLYRVTVLDDQGDVYQFCCPRCTRIWLDRQAVPPRTVTVTDEASGQPIDAGAAWYVRSLVVTTPTTGNRIHVFGDRTAAAHHTATAGGILLPESEKPFRSQQHGR